MIAFSAAPEQATKDEKTKNVDADFPSFRGAKQFMGL